MNKYRALLFAVIVALLATLSVGPKFFNDSVLANQMAAARASGGNGPPQIDSITVCTNGNHGGRFSQGTCDPGTYDTEQNVMGPGGVDINDSDLGAGIPPVPDEHSSVYAPGTLGTNEDYLFFLSTGLGGNAHIGVSVLSGGAGPDENGTWTLGFPFNDGYGFYGTQWGPVFNPSTKGDRCPDAPHHNKLLQDQTFDMHYASAGSVVKDPTGAPGAMLMVYEGTNACIGNSGVDPPYKDDDYISLAIATSTDYGRRWPTYRGTPDFDFVPMPDVNKTEAPDAPSGQLWPNVCIGNDCCTADPCPETPPAGYGRYPVVTPSTSLDYLMRIVGDPLPDKFGEQEISGFVDDVAPGPTTYLYANSGGVKVARAALNGMSGRLDFKKWDGVSFNPLVEGLGGDEMSVLPDTESFENCETADQNQFGSSISYVQETKQYLLTFVCISKGDPEHGESQDNTEKGAAWFWSTSYDLSDQNQWTPPAEIEGSWAKIDDTGGCPDYDGYYPTLMSPGKSAGHLSLNGYVFYLHGCQGGGTPNGRRFNSRSFKISIRPK